MALRWIDNIYDPDRMDAKIQLPVRTEEDRDVAWEQHKSWLADKVIGEPKPTARWNVEQMKQMGVVGVYVNEA